MRVSEEGIVAHDGGLLAFTTATMAFLLSVGRWGTMT